MEINMWGGIVFTIHVYFKLEEKWNKIIVEFLAKWGLFIKRNKICTSTQ